VLFRRVLLLPLLSFVLGGQQEYRVQPKFNQSVGLGSVLERADASKDVWVGEQDFEGIQSQLKDISAGLKSGAAVFPPLSEAAARFRKIELAELKIISSERLKPDAALARVRVRVELGGLAADGSRLSLVGHVIMAWERMSSGNWTLKEAITSPFAEQRATAAQFTDVTTPALGGNASYREQLAHGIDHWRTILDEAVGIGVYGHHGVAVGDYDGDGWEDFYVSQPSGLPNLLYRNNGDGTFTDVTRAAGLDILDDTSMALFADIDNDGDQDLVVLTATEPVLFRNNGRGRFAINRNSGLAIPATRANTLIHMALADYDNDGDLDLYVCSYVYFTPGVAYTEPAPYYDANNGPPNFLFRNRGDGTFEEVTKQAGLDVNNRRFSVAAGWGDYDNDGDQDLYVANDYGRNNLYRNNGDGTFTDVAAAAGVEDMAAGMSVSWGDYDGDGDLDLYVSNMWSSAGQRVTYNKQFQDVAGNAEVRQAFQRHARGNTLFRNEGNGRFIDVTMDAGVEMGRWAWASGFVDLDNDGGQDLYVANGFITGTDLHDL
jgi:hypothetical protein